MACGALELNCITHKRAVSVQKVPSGSITSSIFGGNKASAGGGLYLQGTWEDIIGATVGVMYKSLHVPLSP